MKLLLLLATFMHNVFPALSAELLPAERLLSLTRPLVIAHRGYSAIAPENTLPAFQLALIAGADLVELDYHHSADGSPIVIHDAELDRTTNSKELWKQTKLKVASKNIAELQPLDAGSWFHTNYAGARLPSLNEAIDLIQKQGVTLIERKAGDAATCVKLLRDRNLINHVVVQAFDWAYLKDFHQQEPKQILGALGPPNIYEGKKLSNEEKVLSRFWIDEARGTGARAVVWNKNITSESVKYAHDQSLKVWVYTINDPETAQLLLDMGIDGIISDNVALIWKTLALRKN